MLPVHQRQSQSKYCQQMNKSYHKLVHSIIQISNNTLSPSQFCFTVSNSTNRYEFSQQRSNCWFYPWQPITTRQFLGSGNPKHTNKKTQQQFRSAFRNNSEQFIEENKRTTHKTQQTIQARMNQIENQRAKLRQRKTKLAAGIEQIDNQMANKRQNRCRSEKAEGPVADWSALDSLTF